MNYIYVNTNEITQILNGKKTQFMKVIKPQPDGYLHHVFESKNGFKLFSWFNNIYATELYSLYKVNEVIYCKEPWMIASYKGTGYLKYKNGRKPIENWMLSLFEKYKICEWLSAITMPEWASRCKIKITDLQVKRLMELELAQNDYLEEQFIEDWDKQNPKYKYTTDPWVWVYTFEVVK